MPTAFTGSPGWTAAHPFQLGGPPLISTWSRSLASQALPLLAHAYGNDGVTPNSTTATFGILNRPHLKAKTTNGGYEQIMLEVAAPIAGLTQGNVIRLTEMGSPWKGFVYSGVIESFPDTRSPTGTKHQIVVSPFGWELTRVATQLVYSAAVDVAQMVRDAVALTQHCSCDQVSVPVSTGIYAATTSGGTVDFRNQKINQVLDTARSIAGPTWYWHCDELGRVWFQPQGSGAVYTLYGGQHYEERVTNGGDIQDRINQVTAVGGVPTGGSLNVTTTANGASQSTIGIRALDPPLQIPNITDQAALTAIGAGILATLDQVWTRVQLKALPALGQRIHQSQPGGAMVRYWEPSVNPLPESATGSGYVGPFILQSLDYDGLYQQVEAGSIPVTSQTDIDNMVKALTSRAAANSVQVTAAALNLQQQVLTGTWQSAATPTAGPAALWALSQTAFRAYDSSGVARLEQGNLGANGVSPAGWLFRANAADGTPQFDSGGLINVENVIGSSVSQPFSSSTLNGAAGSSGISGLGGEVTITSCNFSLSRQLTVFILGACAADGWVTTGIIPLGVPIYVRVTGQVNGAASGVVRSQTLNVNTAPSGCTPFQLIALGAGSYTANLIWNSTAGTNDRLDLWAYNLYVFQKGR